MNRLVLPRNVAEGLTKPLFDHCSTECPTIVNSVKRTRIFSLANALVVGIVAGTAGIVEAAAMP